MQCAMVSDIVSRLALRRDVSVARKYKPANERHRTMFRGHNVPIPRTAKLRSVGEVCSVQQQNLMFSLSPRSFRKLLGDIAKSY